MDVWRITLAALRRWYVLAPLLALTGLVVVLSGGRVAPEYEAQASAMLTPERAEPLIPNPYGSLTGANAAIAIVLNSVETRRAVQDQGLSASYEIGAQPRTTIMQIAIRADSAQAAEQTGAAVLELAEQELVTRQTEAGLPPDAQYSLAVLEPAAVTAIVETGKTRVQAVVGVLGAGLSLLVAVLFDDIVGLVRRTRGKRRSPIRRGSAAEVTPPADAPPADAPPADPPPADPPPADPPPADPPPADTPAGRPAWGKAEPWPLRIEPLPSRSTPLPSRSEPHASPVGSRQTPPNGEEGPSTDADDEAAAKDPETAESTATSSRAAQR